MSVLLTLEIAKDIFTLLHEAKHGDFKSKDVDLIKSHLANAISTAISDISKKETITEVPTDNQENINEPNDQGK